MKIDGRQIAEEIINELKKKGVPDKIFAAILVGENEQSESFLRQKEKTAKELGVEFKLYKLEPSLGNEKLREEIKRLSEDKKIGGIILQLPLPVGLEREYILGAISGEKDVDAIGSDSEKGVLAPAVEATKEILERQKVNIGESSVAVLGAGKLVGEPVAEWLEDRTKELNIIDEGDSKAPLIDADIVISGVGKSWLIEPWELKEGCGVIDFGYSYDGKLSGDLKTDDEEALKRLKFYTPTPGGTGPILVAKLFENFYKLCGQL